MRRLTRDPAELIPLKHSTYQVLLALGDGEAMHGYAIMQTVPAMTEGREAILPGTLYAALARMVDEGLVTESTPKGDASFGRAVARAESERLRALLDVARAQNMFGGPK
jgi:DNA-binding PadR family transcriptional regulator